MASDPQRLVIIGAGIVGLGTALAIRERWPGLNMALIEKEPEVGQHQTGHNSGVMHAGIYYKPGSLKAKLCVEGFHLMSEFCSAEGVPFERCGKLIVATSEAELPRLNELESRATANGIEVHRLDASGLRDVEPHAAGISALHSPSTSIVDYGQVARAMKARLLAQGVEIHTSRAFKGLREQGGDHILKTSQGDLRGRWVVNCGGLNADQIARDMGVEPGLRIVPFRGEYHVLAEPRRSLVRGLIYPVPDPDLPFLGVHLTRTIHGAVEAGPNAVLAFAREGYRMDRFNAADLLGTLAYGGFWRLAPRWWRMGLYEYYRAFSKAAFARDLRKLVPELEAKDLVPGGSGVRAQAVLPSGEMADDFHILEGPAALHVLNAPSPAATASLAIGKYLAKRAAEHFGW